MAVRGCQFGGLEDGGVTDRECKDRVLRIYLCKWRGGGRIYVAYEGISVVWSGGWHRRVSLDHNATWQSTYYPRVRMLIIPQCMMAPRSVQFSDILHPRWLWHDDIDSEEKDLRQFLRQYARILTELQNKFYGDMVLCYTKCFDINIDERSTHLKIRERHEINSDPFVVPMIISKSYLDSEWHTGTTPSELPLG